MDRDKEILFSKEAEEWASKIIEEFSEANKKVLEEAFKKMVLLGEMGSIKYTLPYNNENQ